MPYLFLRNSVVLQVNESDCAERIVKFFHHFYHRFVTWIRSSFAFQTHGTEVHYWNVRNHFSHFQKRDSVNRYFMKEVTQNTGDYDLTGLKIKRIKIKECTYNCLPIPLSQAILKCPQCPRSSSTLLQDMT